MEWVHREILLSWLYTPAWSSAALFYCYRQKNCCFDRLWCSCIANCTKRSIYWIESWSVKEESEPDCKKCSISYVTMGQIKKSRIKNTVINLTQASGWLGKKVFPLKISGYILLLRNLEPCWKIDSWRSNPNIYKYRTSRANVFQFMLQPLIFLVYS